MKKPAVIDTDQLGNKYTHNSRIYKIFTFKTLDSNTIYC